jgi:predicted DNA-binding mobile mystery protein A
MRDMGSSTDKSIREIRRSLGLNSEQLGSRVGKAGVTVRYLEKAESTKSATLASLNELADAMDHDLVISYVPRVPVAEQLGVMARKKAEAIVGAIQTSMMLENQELDNLQLREMVEQLTADLVAKPKLIHRATRNG